MHVRLFGYRGRLQQHGSFLPDGNCEKYIQIGGALFMQQVAKAGPEGHRKRRRTVSSPNG